MTCTVTGTAAVGVIKKDTLFAIVDHVIVLILGAAADGKERLVGF